MFPEADCPKNFCNQQVGGSSPSARRHNDQRAWNGVKKISEDNGKPTLAARNWSQFNPRALTRTESDVTESGLINSQSKCANRCQV